MRIQKKTILYAAGVLACGNVVLQLLAFVYRIILSHFAGAEGLGVYRLVNSAYFVLHAGCLSGVTMACSRLSAASEARQEHGKVQAVLRLAFTVFFSLCAVCSSIVLVCHNEIAEHFLGDIRCAKAFPFLLLCLGLTGIENIFKSLFIGLEKMQFTVYSEVGELIIRMIAVGLLLYAYNGEDYGVIAMLIFAGMVISEVFSAVFLTRLFRKNLRRTKRAPIDRALARQFFFIAIPLSVSALLSNTISSAGSVMLPQRLMTAGLSYEEALSALGIVSGMAMPLIILPIALVSSVCTALLPAITAAQAMGKTKRVCTLTGRAISTVGLIAIPATGLLIPIAPYLCKLFFAQNLSFRYVFLLGLVAICSYYQMTTGSLLNALGLQHLNVITAVSSELVQLFMLYRWCARPTLGIYGYLYAMLFSALGAFFINLIILKANTDFTLKPFRRFGVPLLSGATIFCWTRLFFAVFRSLCSTEWLALLLTILGAGGLYLLLLRIFGIKVFRYLSKRIEPTGKLTSFML